MSEEKFGAITILSNKGSAITLSAEDYYLVEFKWREHAHARNVYARGFINGSDTLLHRVVMERVLGRRLRLGENVDHIDGNGLNCSRSNLRVATTSQNLANSRLSKANTSGYKGVSFNKLVKKWNAKIRVNGQLKSLGFFDSPQEASEVYKQAAIEHYGSYARFDDETDKLIVSALIERLEVARTNANRAMRLHDEFVSLMEALPPYSDIRLNCEDIEPKMDYIVACARRELARTVEEYEAKRREETQLAALEKVGL